MRWRRWKMERFRLGYFFSLKTWNRSCAWKSSRHHKWVEIKCISIRYRRVSQFTALKFRNQTGEISLAARLSVRLYFLMWKCLTFQLNRKTVCARRRTTHRVYATANGTRHISISWFQVHVTVGTSIIHTPDAALCCVHTHTHTRTENILHVAVDARSAESSDGGQGHEYRTNSCTSLATHELDPKCTHIRRSLNFRIVTFHVCHIHKEFVDRQCSAKVSCEANTLCEHVQLHIFATHASCLNNNVCPFCFFCESLRKHIPFSVQCSKVMPRNHPWRRTMTSSSIYRSPMPTIMPKCHVASHANRPRRHSSKASQMELLGIRWPVACRYESHTNINM